LALRERIAAAGKIRHSFVSFTEDGSPFETIYLPYNRWREVMETLAVRYRKPYNGRHTFISWRLMKGDNPLLVALEDGHSVETMLRTYAAWIKGAKAEDVDLIKAAMTGRPSTEGYGAGAKSPLASPEAGTRLAPEGPIQGVVLTQPIAAGAGSDTASSCFNKEKGKKSKRGKVAGVEGFEPPYGGIKTEGQARSAGY
jgi:hypothetical protein